MTVSIEDPYFRQYNRYCPGMHEFANLYILPPRHENTCYVDMPKEDQTLVKLSYISLFHFYNSVGEEILDSRLLWMDRLPPAKILDLSMTYFWEFKDQNVANLWDFSLMEELLLEANHLVLFANSIRHTYLPYFRSLTLQVPYTEPAGEEESETERIAPQSRTEAMMLLLEKTQNNQGLQKLILKGEWWALVDLDEILKHARQLSVLTLLAYTSRFGETPKILLDLSDLLALSQASPGLKELGIDVSFQDEKVSH